jgi:hypothetical protein
VDFRNSEIVSFDDISGLLGYSVIGGGERRMLALDESE